MLSLRRYTPSDAELWDRLVVSSRNGTFLLQRPYMDYHADRFCDHSLLYIYKERLVAVLPASEHDNRIVSHGGLTYGGFVLSDVVTATMLGEMLEKTIEYYRQKGFVSLTIKPIPHIYHRQPAEEELYWLFRKNARLEARGLSSTVSLADPLPYSTLRRRKVRNAQKAGCQVVFTEDRKQQQAFWNILTEVLGVRHHRLPVHSFAEMELLTSRFPQNIQHAVVLSVTGEVIAGTVLYVQAPVVHAQYIAASGEGRELGALDLLFDTLIRQCASQGYQYFDFGISTEDGGNYLNEGLIFQKEGFGARSTLYDAYTLCF